MGTLVQQAGIRSMGNLPEDSFQDAAMSSNRSVFPVADNLDTLDMASHGVASFPDATAAEEPETLVGLMGGV